MNDTTKLPIILLADDDPDDQLLVRDALNECGWNGELRCVEDGDELLDYLFHRGKYEVPGSSPHPGLVLMDLNMPLKDGREALQEIRADLTLRRLPVVVLTTSKADSEIDRLYELGANSFVPKPVTYGDLVKVIRMLSQYWFGTVKLPAAN